MGRWDSRVCDEGHFDCGSGRAGAPCSDRLRSDRLARAAAKRVAARMGRPLLRARCVCGAMDYRSCLCHLTPREWTIDKPGYPLN